MDSTKPACYAWAGLNLGIVEAPPIISAAMQRMFDLSRVDVSPSNWHATLRLTLDENGEFFNAMPELIRSHYHDIPTTQIPAVVRRDENEYAIIARGQETGAYVLCSPPYQEFQIRSQILVGRSSPLLFNAVLVPLIRDLLLNQGKILMHAACLATPNGDGLIFIADSGGGKTTTALSLFREGFQFISDDLIALFSQAGQIWIEGVRKTINLSSKTIHFFPELSSVRKTIGKFQAGKAPFDPVVLCGADGLCKTARASSIIIVNVSPKGPKLITRRAADILGALMKSHTFATGAPISKQSLDVLWPLLEQIQTYELITGFDPIAMAEILAKKATHGYFGAAVRLNKRSLLLNIASPERISLRRQKVRLHLASTQKLIDSILGFSLDNQQVDSESVRPLNNPWTLTHFWELMAYHRLDNHLIKFLVQSDTADDLNTPFEPTGAMEEAYATWRTLSDSVAHVYRILNEAGLDAIFLRGPVFAKEYFPEPWLRQCRDIDVVIREKDLEIAEKSLIRSGYQGVGDRDEWLALGELPFCKDGVTVELHWNIYPSCISRHLSNSEFDRCWESRRSSQWNNKGRLMTVSYLEASHLLLSSCLHCIYEHYLDRLVRLVDIRQILRAEADKIDWDWIATQTLAGGHSLAVSYSLYCAQILVKAPVPSEILKRFRLQGLIPHLSAITLPTRTILAGPLASRWRRALFRRLLRISITK